MPLFIAKKYWGQHFLQDSDVAHDIVNALGKEPRTIVEVGPGTGILTRLLAQQKNIDLYLVEIDTNLVIRLKQAYPMLRDRIISANFLKLDLTQLRHGPIAIIGNFPYNISSQIFFKILACRQQVREVVGMIQKEVAERIVAKPGSKACGILSVLLQAFYDLEYLFTVEPQVFSPPPKVRSAVVRLRRNDTLRLGVDEKLFFNVVKAGFQQRRKTLRNALRPWLAAASPPPELLAKRAEQLSVADFVTLTQHIANR